jgi:four helix bundle protein
MDIHWVSTEAAALTHRLTKHLSGKGTCDQARRAAVSVALNTAEGLASQGANERRYLSMAYASCQEAKTAVQLLAMTDQVDLDAARAVWQMLDRAGAMLWGLLGR